MQRDPLPIDDVLPQVRRVLRRGHLVLGAPPGSGKTTGVPPALLREPWLEGLGIVMLQPRRPAARAVAQRMADLLGEPLGQTVGYRVRLDTKVSAATRVEVVTEGMLTRRIQRDPELAGVGLLIFDEFHERSAQADLGLALALDVVESLRPDLRILVMSATMDVAAVSRLLGQAEVLETRGRQFPVGVRYWTDAATQDWRTRLRRSLLEGLNEAKGDALVFLPGRREIEQARETLRQVLPPAVEVLALHGGLTPREQDRVIRGGDRRRVVLATDIAETSLTIPGVDLVVDLGKAKRPRFDPASGLSELRLERIPLASAEQRSGRAGRMRAGLAYRLWHREEDGRREQFRVPELLRMDLLPIVMELAAWGVADPLALGWLDPPPRRGWSAALNQLRDLGLLDEMGRLSAEGRAVARLGTSPRIGVMLVAGTKRGQGEMAARLSAILTETSGRDWSSEADVDQVLASIDWRGRSTVARAALDFARRIRDVPIDHQCAPFGSPGAMLSVAFPDRIAQRRDARSNTFQLVGGRRVRLHEASVLSNSEYLVVPLLDAGAGEGWIRLAAQLRESELRQFHRRRVASSDILNWDASDARVRARRVESLGAIQLRSRECEIPGRELLDFWREHLTATGLDGLDWDESTSYLCRRVQLLGSADPALGLPGFDLASLLADIGNWLIPHLSEVKSRRELASLKVRPLLLDRLDWRQRQLLDEVLPSSFVTPAGSRRRIHYPDTGSPYLSAPLQELFGLEQAPSLARGRVDCLVHLLSPAGRPVQVTADLGGFWRGSYQQVRKEMRGRYPKHDWPEDPVSAVATRGPRRTRPG